MSSNPVGTIGRINNWKTTRDQIVVEEGFNVRFDMGDVEQLGDSIAENGIQRSLNVQRNADGKFVVRDGHRRLAGLDSAIARGKVDAATFEIPIDIEKAGLTTVEQLVLMAIANDGKALLPLEEATLYKRLRDEGVTILDICKKVGRGDVHVRDRLSLLSAAPEVVEAVKNGTVRATLAQQIVAASKKDHGKQRELLAAASSGKEGKKAVREQVDGDAKKKKALAMKVDQIRDDLAAVSEKLTTKLAAAELSRAALRERIGADLYELAKLIGQETALRALVKGAEAAAAE